MIWFTHRDGRIRANHLPTDIRDQLLLLPAAQAVGKDAVSWPATPFVAANIGNWVDTTDTLARGDAEVMRLYVAWRRARDWGDLRTDPTPPPHPSRTFSWVHQNQAYEFFRREPSGALFAAMATGKSKVVVDLLTNLDRTPALILCPAAVVPVWPLQFELHAAEPVPVLTLTGPIKDRIQDLHLFRATKQGERGVVVTNYEALDSPSMRTVLDSKDWGAVILDESHRIKAPAGKRSRFLARLGRRAKFRLILTGTPMSDSPLGVFGQYRFLDPGIFGLNFNRFRERYAVMGGYQNREILRYQNLDELGEKMDQIAYRVDSSVLDLPAELDTAWPVQLPSTARATYQRFEMEQVLELGEGEEVAATNVLTRLLRLQEITSGYLRADEGERRAIPLHNAKTDALQEILTQTAEEPVVVFCRFSRDIQEVHRVARECGRASFELSGIHNDLAMWQADTQPTVLAVQLQAGNAGISLIRASKAVYYSMGFSLTDYQQSRARLNRPGQTRTVSYYHLIATGTIDEYVYTALQKKEDVTSYVVNRLTGRKGASGG